MGKKDPEVMRFIDDEAKEAGEDEDEDSKGDDEDVGFINDEPEEIAEEDPEENPEGPAVLTQPDSGSEEMHDDPAEKPGGKEAARRAVQFNHDDDKDAKLLRNEDDKDANLIRNLQEQWIARNPNVCQRRIVADDDDDDVDHRVARRTKPPYHKTLHDHDDDDDDDHHDDRKMLNPDSIEVLQDSDSESDNPVTRRTLKRLSVPKRVAGKRLHEEESEGEEESKKLKYDHLVQTMQDHVEQAEAINGRSLEEQHDNVGTLKPNVGTLNLRDITKCNEQKVFFPKDEVVVLNDTFSIGKSGLLFQNIDGNQIPVSIDHYFGYKMTGTGRQLLSVEEALRNLMNALPETFYPMQDRCYCLMYHKDRNSSWSTDHQPEDNPGSGEKEVVTRQQSDNANGKPKHENPHNPYSRENRDIASQQRDRREAYARDMGFSLSSKLHSKPVIVSPNATRAHQGTNVTSQNSRAALAHSYPPSQNDMHMSTLQRALRDQERGYLWDLRKRRAALAQDRSGSHEDGHISVLQRTARGHTPQASPGNDHGSYRHSERSTLQRALRDEERGYLSDLRKRTAALVQDRSGSHEDGHISVLQRTARGHTPQVSPGNQQSSYRHSERHVAGEELTDVGRKQETSHISKTRRALFPPQQASSSNASRASRSSPLASIVAGFNRPVDLSSFRPVTDSDNAAPHRPHSHQGQVSNVDISRTQDVPTRTVDQAVDSAEKRWVHYGAPFEDSIPVLEERPYNPFQTVSGNRCVEPDPAKCVVIAEVLQGCVMLITVRIEGCHEHGFSRQLEQALDDGFEFFGSRIVISVGMCLHPNTELKAFNRVVKNFAQIGYAVIVDPKHPIRNKEEFRNYLEQIAQFLHIHSYTTVRRLHVRTPGSWPNTSYTVPRKFDQTLQPIHNKLGNLVILSAAVQVIKIMCGDNVNLDVKKSERAGRILRKYFDPPYSLQLRNVFHME